jgi:ATP-dependent RNA helicase DeaD
MSDYVSTTSFADLPLSDELRKGIADRGYTQPTPVQAAVLGPILAGRDVICRSKTGTGKTAAFGIPLLERIPAGTRKASALVLCNTRELALQVAQEIEALGKHKDLKVIAVYGGAGMGEQTNALTHGAEVIVGTPGRVYDHIRRGNLKLDDARSRRTSSTWRRSTCAIRRRSCSPATYSPSSTSTTCSTTSSISTRSRATCST